MSRSEPKSVSSKASRLVSSSVTRTAPTTVSRSVLTSVARTTPMTVSRSAPITVTRSVSAPTPMQTSVPEDDIIVCRCEDVTLGDIRKAIREGATTMDEIRRVTRAGMGPCQGRTCRLLVASELARATGKPVALVMPSTFRPPVKPVKMGDLAALDAGKHGYGDVRETAHSEAGTVGYFDTNRTGCHDARKIDPHNAEKTGHDDTGKLTEGEEGGSC